jgi:hypothetical protein
MRFKRGGETALGACDRLPQLSCEIVERDRDELVVSIAERLTEAHNPCLRVSENLNEMLHNTESATSSAESL